MNGQFQEILAGEQAECRPENDGTAGPVSGSRPKGVPALETRLPHFVGGPADAVQRLQALKVAVVGCGSVGRNAALHLARFVGELWLVDSGRLKAASLLTHPAITPEDVGASKATNLGRACKRLRPQMRVYAYDGDVQGLPFLAFAAADLVVLSTDNLLAEIEVNVRCLRLRRPLMQCSLHGDTLVAQTRFLANRDGRGPCLACSFSPAEWDHLNAQTRFKCEGQADGEQKALVDVEPTMSTSFLCATAADLGMIQALRFALKLGKPVEDTVLEYCGYTHKTFVSPLAHNEECRCDHTSFDRVTCPMPLSECSLGDLVAAARMSGGAAADGLGFTVGDHLVFVEMGGCACGVSQPVRRFVRPGESAGRCAVCRSSITPHPFHTHRSVPGSALVPVLQRPLRDLGAGDAEWVTIRADDRAVLFCDEAGFHDLVNKAG